MHTSPIPRKAGRSARQLALAASVVAVFGALAVPAVGHAATNFGSRLNHEPANSGECNALATPCTLVSFIHPSNPNGDPYSGGAPVDGVITKFRIRAFGQGNTPATVTFRVADIRLTSPPNNDSALATAAGTGPTVTVQPGNGVDTPIQEFPGSLPVKTGQHLAIDGTNVWATVNNSGDKFTYLFAPPLVEGQGARGSNSATGELLVAATIEPDSDKDGRGDETQDQCPTDPSTGGVCPTPDTAKPTLNGVAFAPGSFRAAGSGGPVAARAPIGARVFYNLSETATVTWRIEKGTVGRRVGGRCVRRTRANRRNRRCLRFVRLAGSFKTTGGLGRNGFRFTGRRNGRKLAVGSYKLVGVAKDPAGNVSTTRKRNFRIVK